MSTEKVSNELRTLVRDAQSLMEATAGDLSDRAKEARSRLSSSLRSAGATCTRLQDRARRGAQATDRVIRHHPYQSIGIALGAGLLIGALSMRRGPH